MEYSIRGYPYQHLNANHLLPLSVTILMTRECFALFILAVFCKSACTLAEFGATTFGLITAVYNALLE